MSGGAGSKANSSTRRRRLCARRFERRLDRRHPPERLADRIHRDEPPDALAGGHEPLVPQQLERPADRDPADARTRGPAPPRSPARRGAGSDPVAQGVGEGQVPHRLVSYLSVHPQYKSPLPDGLSPADLLFDYLYLSTRL